MPPIERMGWYTTMPTGPRKRTVGNPGGMFSQLYTRQSPSSTQNSLTRSSLYRYICRTPVIQHSHNQLLLRHSCHASRACTHLLFYLRLTDRLTPRYSAQQKLTGYAHKLIHHFFCFVTLTLCFISDMVIYSFKYLGTQGSLCA